METIQTKHQAARGTQPDANRNGELWLIKRTSELHATYQIGLLTLGAVKENKKL
jgi:hypothetical protein